MRPKHRLRGSKIFYECDGGTVRFITLDKDWANLLLSHPHPQQRKPDMKHVQRIARALKDGSFIWLCDPIRFDLGGYLIDGQHRCLAVLESGIAIPDMPLVELTAENAIIYIDAVQKVRGPKVVQKMAGDRKTHTTVDAAIILAHDGRFIPASRRGLSVPERLKLIRECDFLDELHTLYSKSNPTGVRFTAGPLGAALACLKVHRGAAMHFFTAVATNRPFTEKGLIQPAEKLTRFLLRSASGDDKGRRSGEAYIIESADKSVRAWNAWARGKTLGHLAPSKDGKVPKIKAPTKKVLAEAGL